MRPTILLFILVFGGSVTNLSGQNSPERKYFNYHVIGTITDEAGRPAADINVCWMPAERAMDGRIPCTKTDERGRYDLSVKDIEDKYIILATSYQGLLSGDGKSPGKAFAEKSGTLKRIKEYRSAVSEVFTFVAADESRTIDMQLTFYLWSDVRKEYLPVKSKTP